MCAFLTSILGEAGYSTGTFISPHLVEVRERFLINGEMVDQESFEGAFETVLEASRKLADQGLCHPTFFEFLFYMAMVLFRMHDVDVMILETGMGRQAGYHQCAGTAGSLCDYLHQHGPYQVSGDTLAKIAGEKAGIIKTGVPLVFDDGQPEVSTILEGFAFRKGAARYPVGRDDFMWRR